MPELPEVEAFRKYFRQNALNKKIKDVVIDDTRIIKVDAKKFTATLTGKSFRDAYRRGKYLFGKWNEKEAVVFHFGMTGYFNYSKDSPIPHSLVRFEFEKGDHLAFVIKRKLGWIDLTGDFMEFCEKKKLGVDALEVSEDRFVEMFSARKSKIKTALMDQSLLAGIGNLYSDEALFQAGILPERSCSSLKPTDLRDLFKKLQRVLEQVAEKRERNEKLPESYLLNHRKKNADCPKCKGKVSVMKINGRSSYFCRSCQR